MYTPLGIKTDYSILKSLVKLEDLISYAKKLNFKSIGILDTNLNASHTFYELCKKNDIKPIIGLDITIDNYRLFLYPENIDALKELFKLIKENDTNIISIKDLEKFNKDIICVLPSESYKIYETINRIFQRVFLSFKNDNEEVNAKVITNNTLYINDIYALNKEDSLYVNYLSLIESNKKLGDIELIDYSKNVLKEENYNTSFLTDLINIEFTYGNKYIPSYIDDSKKYLRDLAFKGLNRRLNNEVSKVYEDRLNYELEVISNMGYTDYFLIVYDYVLYAIKNNIFVGIGRGSAAGSLVAYSLGITGIDPIKYNLLFERFLNPNRVTMPDIDVDFDYSRRDEVVEYIKNKYGNDKVSKIITYGTMTAKDCLRSVLKINNASEEDINSLLSLIDSKKNLKDNLTREVSILLDTNNILKKSYKEAFHLENIKKHISIHAAGVVICSKDLTDLIPVTKYGNEFLTGYTMNELEDLGLLKMDLLSLKNLSIIDNSLKEIEKCYGKKININKINLDDKEVYKLFQTGNTLGIFQFESFGMKKFLTRLKPDNFNDLVSAVSIYRPGPMDSIDTFIENKNKQNNVKYSCELLVPILKDTYGVILYQEQIMEILKKLGNFSYAEADIIRRAISKKKIDYINEKESIFIENAIKNGVDETTAKNIYDDIIKFADFGFNKSHAVAYTMIAYQMAYLKTHFKSIFFTSLLNSCGSDTIKTYIDEAKKMGITINKPDINKSEKVFICDDSSITLPIKVIKGISNNISDEIVNERENGLYKDIFNFVKRCNLNKNVLENLIYAGLFDTFGYNRCTLVKNLDSILMYADLAKQVDDSLLSIPVIDVVDELSDVELMNKEKALFGYYVSAHPSSKYPDCFKQIDIKKYFDKRIETVVLIENIKTVKTKNNTDMAFITASDETTSNEFIVFSTEMKYLDNIKKYDLVKITGKVERRYDKYQIIVNKIEKVI